MVYYNENDPKAAAWLRELIKAGHIAPGHVDERSICDVSANDLRGFIQCHFFAGIGGWSLALRMAGWADDRPVWTGSCPCQPFSAAGKQLGTSDPRHLWPEFLRLIAERTPPTVLGEQVASKAGRLWLARVRADLEALVYEVGAADLCAAGGGAPHIRQRLWWVAYAKRNAGKPRRLADKPLEGLGAPKERTSVELGRRSNLGDNPAGGGVSGRVGLLRGYGNAIVPQLAAEFIQACEEAINQPTPTATRGVL